MTITGFDSPRPTGQGISTDYITQVIKDTSAADLSTINTTLSGHTSQLADIGHMSSFPRLGGETDDTQRFQRAINSFTGNIAGTIQISGDLRLSGQVTCNKTGLRLVGVGNRKSRIVSTYGGIALFIKPLLNGTPYTSVSYCKFFMENVAIVAEGDAIVSGTGLWLQWIYASSFINLYTSGFAKHIVLKGAHLNTFFNLYQGNKDATEFTSEIHNRGIGLSGDVNGVDEGGQTTSNNNHIVGGWINNCHWDLTNLTGTITEKIDIEPASNSFITGDGAIFRECRLERFDYYVVTGSHYPAFPWFIVGSNCKFINSGISQSGASQTSVNPIFQINGDFNEIEILDTIPYNQGLISFGSTAKGNTIIYKGKYDDYQKTILNPDYKQEGTTIKYNSKKNRCIFKDNIYGTITDVVGSHTKAQGEFVCRSSKNTNIVASGDYDYQGCVSVAVDIPLPIGRTAGSTAFTKVTLNTNIGDRRMVLNPPNGQTVPVDGVYTLSATVYIPSSSSANLNVGATLNSLTVVSAKDTWLTVRSRVYLNAGEKIVPTFEMLGISGNVFYVGEISVCDGNTSVYIPNNTYGAISASF